MEQHWDLVSVGKGVFKVSPSSCHREASAEAPRPVASEKARDLGMQAMGLRALNVDK